ncbi:MAG: SpoIIE family protein phosphatase [Microscillaceae bacterium]|nr:SpoIIE family protein phosphatase [Microscillaceae bacterium]
MDENRVFRGYYLVVFGTFIIVLCTAAALAWFQFQNRFEYEKSQIRRQVQDNVSQLNTIISIVHSSLHSIQENAEFYLLHKDLVSPSPLFKYLKDQHEDHYFHLDQLPDSLKKQIGNITGLGVLGELSDELIHEINIALQLNPIHKSILDHTPNVVLTYTSFRDCFVNIYPFIPSKDFRVDKAVFDRFHTTYFDVFPEQNPHRQIKWTAVYVDETGKGLMVSAIIPLYKANHYEGLAGIDLTLDSLNKIIGQSQRELGEIFLINDKKQLLAHPRLVSSAQKEVEKSLAAFPKPLKNMDSKLDHWEEKKLHQLSGYLLYYESVPGTSWKLVYVVSIWETYLSIFYDIGVSTIFILVSISLVLVITSYYTRKRFIQPAHALIEHIQRENSALPLLKYSPPTQWKPWFGIITNIFQNNRDLIQELKTHNEHLEHKVIERTQEIAAQNEELIQNQEEITTQRDYIEKKNQELELFNDKLKANELVLRKSYEKLIESQQKISLKNQELEERNRQIRSSINAALSIQTAILPYPHRMQKILGEHFVIYKPKDVVSGDFYWVNTVKNARIIVTADCTGHGVPGALMSMIGNTVLDKVISLQQHTNPSEILEQVHKEVKFALKQAETQNNNGMDMSVLVLEEYSKGLTLAKYAGAKSSMFFRYPLQKQVIEVKGSRRSIGGIQNLDTPFECREIIFSPGTQIYMGSDGFVDQNNSARKRLGEKAFRKLLCEINAEPLPKQKEILEEKLILHMQGTQQRDDILLIGFKLE